MPNKFWSFGFQLRKCLVNVMYLGFGLLFGINTTSTRHHIGLWEAVMDIFAILLFYKIK